MIRERWLVVLGLCLGAASGVAALGAQLEGIKLLLPRDTPLAATPTGWAGRSGANAWN